MNVLSLFDGMSCGHIALDRAGVKVGNCPLLQLLRVVLFHLHNMYQLSRPHDQAQYVRMTYRQTS